MTKQELIKTIDPLLKAEGYKRKGNSWHKESDDLITIFYLSRHRFANKYFIYVGAAFKQLLEEGKVTGYGHTGRRSEDLIGWHKDEPFDLENDLADPVREEKIREIVNKLIPVMKEFETVEGLRQIKKQHPNMSVYIKAQPLFFEVMLTDKLEQLRAQYIQAAIKYEEAGDNVQEADEQYRILSHLAKEMLIQEGGKQAIFSLYYYSQNDSVKVWSTIHSLKTFPEWTRDSITCLIEGHKISKEFVDNAMARWKKDLRENE